MVGCRPLLPAAAAATPPLAPCCCCHHYQTPYPLPLLPPHHHATMPHPLPALSPQDKLDERSKTATVFPPAITALQPQCTPLAAALKLALTAATAAAAALQPDQVRVRVCMSLCARVGKLALTAATAAAAALQPNQVHIRVCVCLCVRARASSPSQQPRRRAAALQPD